MTLNGRRSSALEASSSGKSRKRLSVSEGYVAPPIISRLITDWTGYRALACSLSLHLVDRWVDGESFSKAVGHDAAYRVFLNVGDISVVPVKDERAVPVLRVQATQPVIHSQLEQRVRDNCRMHACVRPPVF